MRDIARRDRIAHWLANRALRIATPWYRNMIEGAIRYGLRHAAQLPNAQRPNAEVCCAKCDAERAAIDDVHPPCKGAP